MIFIVLEKEGLFQKYRAASFLFISVIATGNF